MPTETGKITTYLDLEAERVLERIAQQERRSKSKTIAFLILKEGAARGFIGRAPESTLKVVRDQDGPT